MSSTMAPGALRQIRFVNNEGQPPPKRRRISAACRTCRKRKTRCDGTKPICSTCTDNGHDCQGYAEIDIKKEPRGFDETILRAGDEEFLYEEEDIVSPTMSKRSPRSRRASAGGSPVLRRVDRGYSSTRPPRSGKGPVSPATATKTERARAEYKDVTLFPDHEGASPTELQLPPSTESHRVPYFRYFGPTAIVPGFKQMVVSVREHRPSIGAASAATTSPSSGGCGGGSVTGGTPSQAQSESKSSIDMPTYDPDDPLPVHRLIIHLIEIFFVHVGCNYPFLSKRQPTFKRLVEEKKIAPILVDAVCALAARFSDHPLLNCSHESSIPKSEYGQVFAQRARSAVTDTFPCPTVAATQACLLLAYESFGSNQDSALWMYLGCAIRMAVDLGLQKLDGVRHHGQDVSGYAKASASEPSSESSTIISEQQKKEFEQERVDTLWAVFMLDRVISSGVGRPVTLRYEDFELTFPTVNNNVENGWPKPFPALIQIIHLYGRVSDSLNKIRDIKDVTPALIRRLSGMEKSLTQFYQKLDQRLTFNATNFQHYVKAGESTNFILVHFWFHTLIMLFHQPSLMHSFEGEIQQLLPNSRELSMSSAKTIADILAFAELIDPKSFIGSPFTSQPIYIAACAFLKEASAHTSSQPTSRDASPPSSKVSPANSNNTRPDLKQKHSLLAQAANQNYQCCYKALQQLEYYWAGIRYILVALDQKQSGIDPQNVQTYTAEEYESTKVRAELIPRDWTRRPFMAPPASPGRLQTLGSPSIDFQPGSPNVSQAFGCSLTGTTDSPNSHLTWMYPNPFGDKSVQIPTSSAGIVYDPARNVSKSTTPASLAPPLTYRQNLNTYSCHSNISQSMQPPTSSDAGLLLGLQSPPFPSSSTGPHRLYDQQHTSHPSHPPRLTSSPNISLHSHIYDFPTTTTKTSSSMPSNSHGLTSQHHNQHQPLSNNGYMSLEPSSLPEMMMESQDIDMSSLLVGNGGDFQPWLEYLPTPVQGGWSFWGSGQSASAPNGVELVGAENGQARESYK